MRLPKLAIENYQFVLVLLLLAVALGTLSFFNMPRSEDPALNFPSYIIVAVYPGTSPQDMEELVVDPIEEAVNEVEDVDHILTSIEDGLAVIRVDGYFGIDIDEQFDEVQAKLNNVRNELPAGLLSLDIRQITPLDVKILQLALVSEAAPYKELIDWGENLEDRIEKIDGVRTVEVEAFPQEEVRIALDFEKMRQLNIPLTQVIGLLQANNANIPAGDLNAGGQNFSLKTSGGYESMAQLRRAVISSRGDGNVYLDDIADVYMDYEDDQWIGRYDGERALFVSVTQKKGKNILAITEEIDQVVATYAAELPPNIELATSFKQGPAVESRVNEFFGSLLQGVLLVGLTVLIFLGVRNALIIVTVIPASIIMAIYLLDVSGFGLQQISIAGLVIALGLLVDNGIVVVENINRYLKEGYSKAEAAIKGTQEVGWAIMSSTATTVLAFFPVTQLGGGVGDFIQSLPITVIFSLLASLLLALALTPLLSSQLQKASVSDKVNAVDRFLKNLIVRAYRPVLNYTLRRPFVVLGIALLTLGGAFALFPLVGVSFFPTADKPILLVNIDTPKGTSLGYTNKVARYVESTLDSVEYVQSYTTNVGHGNPQIYYNVIPENTKKNHAQLVVNLGEWDTDRFYALVDELRAKFDRYPGAKITLEELKNGPPYEAPIAIKVRGSDLDKIAALSDQVAAIIANQPGTINLDNPLAIGKTNLRARINRDKAGMLGVQLSDIDLAVRTAVAGNTVGTLNTPAGEEYPMVARLAFEREPRPSDFAKVSLGSVTGAQVPLQQLVELGFEADAAQIDHFDLQRTNTIIADVTSDYNVTQITLDIIEAMDQMDWPQGYDYYVAGEYETQQDSFGELGQQLLFAVLGILAVLILQFRSFAQPVIVLAAIPLAISGSVVALYLTGNSFSFFAFIGFTSLVGIVVNTSIILVDYTNQLRAQGIPIGQAIRQAAETRFTPILLTTLTTILGLLPLTLTGGRLWEPLGWTIIGGMISSTLLTLLMVPMIYQWVVRK